MPKGRKSSIPIAAQQLSKLLVDQLLDVDAIMWLVEVAYIPNLLSELSSEVVEYSTCGVLGLTNRHTS